MELAIQVEGQSGLNWPRWKRLARAVEDCGYAALYRSDHIINLAPPDQDSLELWTSLTWLADNTRRIEFGPLVSPVSFRHPVLTAYMAIAVDNLSGGRLRLGLGAGWVEREHTNFGFDLLPLPQRFARFEEALQVITRLLRQDEPANFEGKYYRLHEARLLPRPQRPGGPPIVIGGRGAVRTLRLAAKYADEWNTYRIPTAQIAALSQKLDHILAEYGRSPTDLRRTLMVNIVYGQTDAQVKEKMRGLTFEQLREKGVVGTPAQIIDQLGQYAELGIQRVILQWFDLDDIAGIESIAANILSRVQQ